MRIVRGSNMYFGLKVTLYGIVQISVLSLIDPLPEPHGTHQSSIRNQKKSLAATKI